MFNKKRLNLLEGRLGSVKGDVRKLMEANLEDVDFSIQLAQKINEINNSLGIFKQKTREDFMLLMEHLNLYFDFVDDKKVILKYEGRKSRK